MIEVSEVEPAAVPDDETCPACSGRGRAHFDGRRCTLCLGEGVVHRLATDGRGRGGARGVHRGTRRSCDQPACLAAWRRPRLQVGDRFWSEGLGCPCRVVALGQRELRFVSESTTEPNIDTTITLDLAAHHLGTGRWRVLSTGPVGPTRTTTEHPLHAPGVSCL